MIVQCPHCSDRYRVNEQNIPSTGGRIRCPKCSSTFVVYPTSAQQAAQQPAAPSYDGEKTSVATNLSDLMGSLGQQAAAAGPPAGQDEELATEVISGDSLPSFAGGIFGGGANASADPPEEDGTVEMENPLVMAGIQSWNQQAGAAGGEGYDKTEIVSADEAVQMLGGGDPYAAVDKTEIVDPATVDFNDSLNPFGGAQPPQQPPQQQQQPAFQAQQPQQQPAFQAPQQPPQQGGFGNNNSPPAQPQQQQPPAPAMNAAAPAAQAGGPDPNHAGPWKLKTNFGLTYEFPDTKGLQGWMDSRDDFDGYTLSAGDDEFFPLTAFPQIRAGAGGGAPTANTFNQAQPAQQNAGFGQPQQQQQGGFGQQQGGFGGGQQGGFGGQPGPQRTNRPKHNTMPPQPVSMTSAQLPSRDAKWNKVLWLLFIVLFIGCSILAAQITGVVDFKAMLGLSSPETKPPVTNEVNTTNETTPAGAAETTPEEDEPAKLSASQMAEVDALVEEARAEVEGNKFGSAKSKLEIAKDLDPSRFEVYDLLVKVYESTGEAEKAKATRMEVQALRAKSSADEKPQ